MRKWLLIVIVMASFALGVTSGLLLSLSSSGTPGSEEGVLKDVNIRIHVPKELVWKSGVMILYMECSSHQYSQVPVRFYEVIGWYERFPEVINVTISVDELREHIENTRRELPYVVNNTDTIAIVCILTTNNVDYHLFEMKFEALPPLDPSDIPSIELSVYSYRSWY